MNTITIDKQIPISEARNNLASVFRNLKTKKVCYVVRNYKPLGAIIDLKYLEELKRQADMFQMEMARRKLQDQFADVLRKHGYDPATVSEKVVNSLLMLND